MPSPLIWGGLAIGLALGAVLERSRFCMVAALSNYVLMRDTRQVHAWLAVFAFAGYLIQFGPIEPLRVKLASASAWNLPLADGSIAAALGIGIGPAAALCSR